MKTAYILLGIILILLVSIFILEYSNKSNNSVLPLELSKDFDPKINPVMLKVKGIVDEYSSLNVEVVFPSEFLKGVDIDTRIDCSEDDMRIYYTEENNVVSDRTLLFDTISSDEYESILLSGLCRDDGCESIDRDCKLFVN